jgi:hypothetical protein
MKPKVNWYGLGFALVLAAVLTISCRPRSSEYDCNDQNWKNPTIVVGADHVDVVLFDDYAHLPLDQLRDYLSELPNRYWGRGRFVRISEGGLRAPHTDDVIRRNMKQTEEILESLGIQIKCRNALIGADVRSRDDADHID